VTVLLEAEDLHVAYGRVEAVRGVSLTLAVGQIVTVIGANGAGKTTLLSALIGLLPVRGRIRYDGADVTALEVEDRVERGMCLVPEQRELFAAMTVADNLLLGGYVWRRDRVQVRDRLGEIWALFPHLAERRNQVAGTLSGGERQMLALGRALMSRPRLLLLDEPSLGLAPLVVRDIFRAIIGLRANGVSILLVEQNARAALECADYAYLLETGEVRLHGPATELLRDPRLASLYLGGDVG
jgi:branched-chain amino acid transport system ATP-binding protein